MALYRPPHLRRAESTQFSESTLLSKRTSVVCGQYALFCERRGRSSLIPWSSDVITVSHTIPSTISPDFWIPTRERLIIAIDPFTGRNPSYCFVDLPTTGDAERAIAELNERDLLGRPVRVKLGVPHQIKKGGRPFPPNQTHVERLPYEKISSQSICLFISSELAIHSGRGRVWDRWQKTESEAASHWRYTRKGARVFVGNLPGFPNPARVDAEIKEFFEGFEIVAISKIIRPRSADVNSLPHHTISHYLFVDLTSTAEADRAVRTLHGHRSWNRLIKVAIPTDTHSWKIEERDRYLTLNPPPLPGGGADW
ncbi:hypothetical protein E4T56_gene18808 [Termitomyces sp. T112]|nr:hypothetical protein E4T56_gene18808 [Termitomyces sp. T112]